MNDERVYFKADVGRSFDSMIDGTCAMLGCWSEKTVQEYVLEYCFEENLLLVTALFRFAIVARQLNSTYLRQKGNYSNIQMVRVQNCLTVLDFLNIVSEIL